MFVFETPYILLSAVLWLQANARRESDPVVFFYTALGVSLALLIGVSLYARRRRSAARRRKMEAFAAEHGWRFHPRAHSDLLRATDGFRGVFAPEVNPSIENVISRTRHGVTVALFDFCLGGRPRYRSVACVWSETLHLPYFVLRRADTFVDDVRNFLFRRVVPAHLRLFVSLLGWFMGDHKIDLIDIDEHPAFSEFYCLGGEDEAAVRKLFSLALLDFFVARASLRQHDIMVEGENNCLMLHPRTVDLPPAELVWLIDETEAVFGALLRSQPHAS